MNREATKKLKALAVKKQQTEAFPSSEAKKKAVWRVKQRIPQSAKKYAVVVEGLIQTASPRKKVQLAKLGIDTSTRTTKEVI